MLVPRRAFSAALPALLLSTRSPAAEPSAVDRIRLPAPSRTVAVGDLHGDCDAFVNVLRTAGLVDATARWTGGDAVLVQCGDVLDRGPQEAECLALLRSLKMQAAAAGGRVVTLLGNHEVLNACGVTSFVSEAGATAFGAPLMAVPSRPPRDCARFTEVWARDRRRAAFPRLPSGRRPGARAGGLAGGLRRGRHLLRPCRSDARGCHSDSRRRRQHRRCALAERRRASATAAAASVGCGRPLPRMDASFGVAAPDRSRTRPWKCRGHDLKARARCRGSGWRRVR